MELLLLGKEGLRIPRYLKMCMKEGLQRLLLVRNEEVLINRTNRRIRRRMKRMIFGMLDGKVMIEET